MRTERDTQNETIQYVVHNTTLAPNKDRSGMNKKAEAVLTFPARVGHTKQNYAACACLRRLRKNPATGKMRKNETIANNQLALPTHADNEKSTTNFDFARNQLLIPGIILVYAGMISIQIDCEKSTIYADCKRPTITASRFGETNSDKRRSQEINHQHDTNTGRRRKKPNHPKAFTRTRSRLR